MDRFNVCVARKYMKGGEEKTKWTTIGVAFVRKSGPGYNIILDAAPLTNEMFLLPPKDPDERSSGHGSSRYGDYDPPA